MKYGKRVCVCGAVATVNRAHPQTFITEGEHLKKRIRKSDRVGSESVSGRRCRIAKNRKVAGGDQ